MQLVNLDQELVDSWLVGIEDENNRTLVKEQLYRLAVDEYDMKCVETFKDITYQNNVLKKLEETKFDQPLYQTIDKSVENLYDYLNNVILSTNTPAGNLYAILQKHKIEAFARTVACAAHTSLMHNSVLHENVVAGSHLNVVAAIYDALKRPEAARRNIPGNQIEISKYLESDDKLQIEIFKYLVSDNNTIGSNLWNEIGKNNNSKTKNIEKTTTIMLFQVLKIIWLVDMPPGNLVAAVSKVLTIIDHSFVGKNI